MADPLGAVVSLLEDNWTSANTDNITPDVVAGYSEKRMTADQNHDVIRVYPYAPKDIELQSLGAPDEKNTSYVSIDVFVKRSRTHAEKVKEEVERIVNNNMKNPHADYQYIQPVRVNDQTFGMKRLFHYIVDVQLINWGVSRNT